MPVQKFKTFEEAGKALWNFNPGSEYYNKLRAFFELYSKLSKFSYPEGIFKFHSLEEAEEHKRNLIINAAIIGKRTGNE